MTQNGGFKPREAVSCPRIQWLPELSCDGQYDGVEFNFKNWPCIVAEGENFKIVDHYEDDGGGAAVGEEGEVVGIKKGPWTAEEDEKLKKCVEEHGIGNWITIEKYSGLGRTSKSCRLRWTNHLRPNLKKGSFTPEEENLVVKLHQKYGNKWSYISSKLPGRTDNEVKNFWHGRVRRCRRKFLPIYPENIEEDGSRRDGFGIDGKNHSNDDDNNPTVKDDTSSIPPFPSITLLEFQRPLSYSVASQQHQSPVVDRNLPSAFTPLLQTQLFSPHQEPVSSPHGFSSSHHPSSACYPTQMPPSAISTPSQTQCLSVQQFQSTESPDATSQNLLLTLQKDCSSGQQSDSKTAVTLTPFRTPPVLSSSVGQFKRSQRSSSLLSSPHTIIQTSAPAQGSSISASGSSVSSIKINTSSLVLQDAYQLSSSTTGSLLCSSELHLTVQQPTASSVQLHSSSMPSAFSSCNLNSAKLKDLTMASPHSPLSLNFTSAIQPHSSLQVNPCAAPCLVSSALWNLSISEPPSVQTPTSALRPTPDMKITQLETDAERIVGVLDAPMEEAQSKADVLYQNLPKEQCVDRCLINKDLLGNMLVTETVRDNVLNQSSREGGFLREKTRTMNLLGQSLNQGYMTKKLSKTPDLMNKSSYGKNSHNKCSRPENLEGKISRREGLLSEISKTGVLLVESEKKEILLQEFINESSTRDIFASQRSKTGDLQLGEISKRRKLLGGSLSTEDQQIHNKKGSVGEKSEGDFLISEKLTSLVNLNSVQNTFDFSSRKSILLTLQEQMCDPDAFGLPCSPKDVTTGLKSDGLLEKLRSVQVASSELCGEISRNDVSFASQRQEHEFETLGPVLSHCTEVALLEYGDEGGNSNYDYLDKSTREECPETSKGEFIDDQTQCCHFMGEGLIPEGLLASKDRQEILSRSVSDLDKYPMTNMLRSPSPDGNWSSVQPCGGDLLEEDLKAEGSPCKTLKYEVCLDEASRGRFLGESSSERMSELHELTLNEFVSSASKNLAANLLTSRSSCSEAGFAQCYEGDKVKQEMGEDHMLPEELSSLVEFSPTTLPDWNDIGCETSNIIDMTFGLEMYHLHPITR